MISDFSIYSEILFCIANTLPISPSVAMCKINPGMGSARHRIPICETAKRSS